MPTATTVTSRRFDELTAREFHDLLRLRIDVFVVEQTCPYPELDGRDVESGTEHHWLTGDGGTPACYARTLQEATGHDMTAHGRTDHGTSDDVIRIGRVVTAADARGHGLAAALMSSLVERFGDRTLVLDAQSYLTDWYRRFGFEPEGEEFVEDGIPHVPMRRLAHRAD